MRRARAMTLVEVLAALALLVVLSGGVVGFFVGMTQRRDELARLAAQQRDVSRLLDRLEAGLAAAVAVAPDGSAGVRGDERSLTLVTRTLATVLRGEHSVADAAVVGFAFDERRAVCECSVSPASESAGDRVPDASGGAPPPEAGPLTEPILEHVDRMRFRYLRGRAWESEFDSLQAGALPSAVEVSIWLAPRTDAPAPSPAPVEGLDPLSGFELGGDEEILDFGPLDYPPEPEEEPWVPREPDHVRVMLVPDAPAAGWAGGAP